jgi:hypothetical protein
MGLSRATVYRRLHLPRAGSPPRYVTDCARCVRGLSAAAASGAELDQNLTVFDGCRGCSGWCPSPPRCTGRTHRQSRLSMLAGLPETR